MPKNFRCRDGVVAIGGRIGAGKSDLATGLSQLLQWRHASFGGFLKDAATAEGLGDSRESLQALGERFMSGGIALFVDRVLEHADWKPGDPIVIDGVRHVTVLAAVKDRVNPLPVAFIFLSLEEEERRKRLVNTGVHEDQITAWDRHSTERDVVGLDRLRAHADLIADAGNSVDDLLQLTTMWIAKRFGPVDGKR